MRALTEIVLASQSPRRLELLGTLGLHVRVVVSDVEEGPRPGTTPLELARLHAAAKARAVSDREPHAFVVAADTVVDLDGRDLGKPKDAAEARAMLEALSGREHRVHTAYVAHDGVSGRSLFADSSTTVWFAELDATTIERYIESGDPFDKAGSYGIQGPGAALVERIDGDFYTVMGFPLGDFVRRLTGLGYRLPQRSLSIA
jgi:septum formation protein